MRRDATDRGASARACLKRKGMLVTHYNKLFDKEYLGHYDLPDRDVVVVIEEVIPGQVQNGNKKDRKPIFRLRGKEKKMICNATNAKTIARLYGSEVEDWVGKSITLYKAETNAQGGEVVPCIRVRPAIPQPKQKATEPSEEQPS